MKKTLLLILVMFVILFGIASIFNLPHHKRPEHYIDMTIVSVGANESVAKERAKEMAGQIGEYDVLDVEMKSDISVQGPIEIVYYICRLKVRVDTDKFKGLAPLPPAPNIHTSAL